MLSLCVVPNCHERGGHKFPADLTLRKRWLIVIRRDKWEPNERSRVCHQHFADSDYKDCTSYSNVTHVDYNSKYHSYMYFWRLLAKVTVTLSCYNTTGVTSWLWAWLTLVLYRNCGWSSSRPVYPSNCNTVVLKLTPRAGLCNLHLATVTAFVQ